MKITSLSLPSAAGVVLTAVLMAASAAAQAPQQGPAGGPPAAAGGAPHHDAPKPENLKVLPKDLTGEQVHHIMHQWAEQLGAECTTCHVTDSTRKMPNGRPAINFADDSKKEKQTARLMYKMTQDINSNYISMVDNSGVPVSCGTCHRGHIGPEPFVAPKGDHDHDHPASAATKPPAH